MYSQVLEISSLSEYDYALINATWLNLMDENFKCKKVEAELSKRSDAEIQIKIQRISKGCGVLSDSPKIEINHVGFHSCLCHESFQHPQLGYFMSIYQNYEKGILPFSGGLMDQPAQIVELLGLISNLHSEREFALQEKERNKKPTPKGK